MSHDINCEDAFYNIVIVWMLFAGKVFHLAWKPVIDRAYIGFFYSNILSLENDQVVSAYLGDLFGFVNLGLEICALL